MYVPKEISYFFSKKNIVKIACFCLKNQMEWYNEKWIIHLPVNALARVQRLPKKHLDLWDITFHTRGLWDSKSCTIAHPDFKAPRNRLQLQIQIPNACPACKSFFMLHLLVINGRKPTHFFEKCLLHFTLCTVVLHVSWEN